MSQLTDFLMIGMMGLGGVFIFFNWDQVEAFLKGGGSCSGTSGNCTYNKCKDGRTQADWCWSSNGIHGAVKSCTHTPIDDPDNEGIQVGCDTAKINWCAKNSADGKCGGTATCKGGYVPSGGKCVCNATAKNCTSASQCVSQTSTACTCKALSAASCQAGYHPCRDTAAGNVGRCSCCKNTGGGGSCTKGYMPCSGGCCCNRTVKNCTSGQIVGVLNGICSCQNCPTGTKAGGTTGNSCVPISGGNVTICGAQANGAQAWIARVAIAILGRMCNSCNKGPSITQLMQGWPSLTQQLAVENNCNSNKLHKSNATFNKHFAQLLIAVRNAYAIPITVNAANALSVQSGNGVWWMTPWEGGVAGYRARADPATGYGMAYSATLVGRENMWDPYGNQKYSFTLPKGGMKVKVSN